MKKNILLFIVLFIYTCDDGPSSPSPQTNCDICPNGATGIELQNILDGNTTCEQAYDIVGCVNVIDFLPLSGVHFGEGADTYDDSLHIIFNTDYNITGFQFELDGLDITSINPQSNANFTITHSSTTMEPEFNTIVGFNSNNDIIPAGCGILFTVYHTETDFEYWNYSNFISNLVFTNDDNPTFNPPGTTETCFNVTDDL